MEINKTAINGVFIIEPKVFYDARGYFFESFSCRDFDAFAKKELGYKVDFVQDNESMSSYGVMDCISSALLSLKRNLSDV